MMLKKTSMTRLTITLFTLFSIAIMACGGGGSSTTPASTPTPRLSVNPADHDFGIVTDSNAVKPLEVILRNNGTASLDVSTIELSDPINFVLDLDGGENPCGSSEPTIAAGSNCTVTVDFNPQAFDVPIDEDLIIESNDPASPTYLIMRGIKENITSISVKINQVEACPRPVPPATLFVSVLDQGGFPVTTLDRVDFEISENGGANTPPATAVRVDDTVTLSIALLLDFSGSITSVPDNVTDMKNAAIGFVDQLGINDEAEIIKYASEIEVTQPFTSDKVLLKDAIQSDPDPADIGVATALFDAVEQAVSNISNSTRTRRAIIIITDGEDRNSTGTGPESTATIATVIADANGNSVPVFTVGLGAANATILQQLADDTGGTFSDSPTSANLASIYQNLADLLFTDQYILTYTSDVPDTDTGNLTVTATFAPGVTGTDTKINGLPVCSP